MHSLRLKRSTIVLNKKLVTMFVEKKKSYTACFDLSNKQYWCSHTF